MKTRFCVRCEHTLVGDDADMMGEQTNDGFVCHDCNYIAADGGDDGNIEGDEDDYDDIEDDEADGGNIDEDEDEDEEIEEGDDDDDRGDAHLT